jgi:hypothetical protein
MMSTIGSWEAVWAIRLLNNPTLTAYNSVLFQGVTMRVDLDIWESRDDELLS